jgi:hypothetical protein
VQDGASVVDTTMWLVVEAMTTMWLAAEETTMEAVEERDKT